MHEQDYQSTQLPTPLPPPPPPQHEFTGYPFQQTLEDGPWSHSLCSCCEDCRTCCLTYWCPCITFGRIVDIIDKGNTSCGVAGAVYFLLMYFTGCGCLFSCVYRSKMRIEYKLLDAPCNDCCVHFCCEPCALCQEYRELEHRGFDMSLGWQGNLTRQSQSNPMAPPTAPMME